MKQFISVVSVVAVLAFVGQAFATNPVGGTVENETTNIHNTANGGAGGQGGQGGKGGDAKATATGGNANQSQGQIQQQSNQIKNSGNSSSSSSATGGSVKNSGNSSSKSSATGTGVGVGVSGATANNGGVTVNEGSTKAIGYAAPPTMGTASLVAAPETCMGSTSASLSGGNGIVGAGIGFGKTYESANCNRRMNARYLLSMGHGDAALALLAQDDDVRKALEDAGVEVPNKRAEKAAALKAGGKVVTAVDDTLPVTPSVPLTGPGAASQVQSN